MSSEPDVDLLPDQAPEAEHEEAFAVDQVNVVSSPNRTDSGSADRLTEAGGDGGGVGVVSPPPPPPPPHETRTITLKKGISFCLKFIIAGLFMILKKPHL